MKMIIRIILFLASAFFVLMNIGPFFTSGEINIGLITGLFIGVLMLVYGIFFNPINALIAKWWHCMPGKIILSVTAVILSVSVAVCGVTLINVMRFSRESNHKTEYIIVLGCKVNGTVPGRYLSARLNTAYRYLTDNPDSKAILSGGQGDGEDIPEGECMFNYLTARGIDPSRLITETESSSTYENFGNSLNMLGKSGIEISEITVITNDYHEYRAAKTAEKFGVKAYPYPAKSPWIGYLPFAIREVYAIIYQIYLGR